MALTTKPPLRSTPMTQDPPNAIAALLAVLTQATSGNLRVRADLPDDAPDDLRALGQGVNGLIEAWRASELRGRKAKRALEEKIATVEAQAITIRELSSPVLQIWRSTLLLPLVGALTEQRSADVTDELLRQLAYTQAHQVIIDVTGVQDVDERIAEHLIRLARAARLLGARCIITGVGPQVAQTFASLGIDFAEIQTLRTLERGLMEFISTGDARSTASGNRHPRDADPARK